MLNRKQHKGKDQVPHQDITIIGKECTINGDVFSSKPVRLDGKVKGLVQVDESLIVGSLGEIEGNVIAGHVVIYGKVAGNISAGKMELRSAGKVSGNIDSQLIEMEAGAHYTGEMKIGNEAEVSAAGEKDVLEQALTS